MQCNFLAFVYYMTAFKLCMNSTLKCLCLFSKENARMQGLEGFGISKEAEHLYESKATNTDGKG